MSWKKSRQLAVSSMLPGAGAVLNMMQPAANSRLWYMGSTGSAHLLAHPNLIGFDVLTALNAGFFRENTTGNPWSPTQRTRPIVALVEAVHLSS